MNTLKLFIEHRNPTTLKRSNRPPATDGVMRQIMSKTFQTKPGGVFIMIMIIIILNDILPITFFMMSFLLKQFNNSKNVLFLIPLLYT